MRVDGKKCQRVITACRGATWCAVFQKQICSHSHLQQVCQITSAVCLVTLAVGLLALLMNILAAMLVAFAIEAVYSMMRHCSGIILGSKRVFETYGGCLGQALLFMAAGYKINHDCSAALIHEYFGCSNSQNQTLTNIDAANWISEVSLPRVVDDPLLFMLLANSPYQASFLLNNVRDSYRHFLLAMMNSSEFCKIFSISRTISKNQMMECFLRH